MKQRSLFMISCILQGILLSRKKGDLQFTTLRNGHPFDGINFYYFRKWHILVFICHKMSNSGHFLKTMLIRYYHLVKTQNNQLFKLKKVVHIFIERHLCQKIEITGWDIYVKRLKKKLINFLTITFRLQYIYGQ